MKRVSSSVHVPDGLPPGWSDDQFDQWNRRIERTVLSIVRDREAARDICQDVWLRFIEHRPHEAERANLDAWLLTVARRLALNHVASGAVRFRAALTVDELDLAARGPSPADAIGQAQDERRIDAILSALSPRHEAVIRLCDIEGLSYGEAADRMALSAAAVTSLLHRARQAFRRMYLLAVAPPWLRALAEAGPVDDALGEIDPFAPPADLGDVVERRAHDLFSGLADRWDRIRNATVPDELDAAVAERARLAPDDSALDVGTGTGIVALHVAPHVRRVVGIDRSLGMLRVARNRVAASGRRNVLMEFGDLLQLPIRPQSIDVAFCSLVLRLVRRPAESVRHIAGTLRPGGRLVVCDIARTSRPGDAGLAPEQVRTWLGDAGLEGVTIDLIGARKGRFLVAVGRR